MKIYKLYIAILTLILLAPQVIAISTLGTFKSGEAIDLIQTCSNCSYINVSSVTAPNSTIIVQDAVMSKNGVLFNYSMNGQETIGIYNVCGEGDLDGETTVWCYDFEVTATGFKPDTAQGLIYFILLALSSGIFLVLIVAGIKVDPDKYKRNSISGDIVGVNYGKYWRMACWVLAYAMAVWISSLSRTIAENFLNSEGLALFFKALFYILISGALPFFLVYMWILIVSLWTDKKVMTYIERGLKP